MCGNSGWNSDVLETNEVKAKFAPGVGARFGRQALALSHLFPNRRQGVRVRAGRESPQLFLPR